MIPLHRLMMRGRGAAVVRRTCSSSSKNIDDTAKTKEERREALVIITGAAAGAVMCVAAKLKRDTDSKRSCCIDDDNYAIRGVGGAAAGSIVGFVWLLSPAVSGVIAAILALDWLDLFPTMTRTLHVLRHGEQEKKGR